MEKKFINYLWKALKVLIFLSFVYTSVIMFRLRNPTTAILIIFAVSFFLIFNKIDSMNKSINERMEILEEELDSMEVSINKRLKELEEK